MAIDEDDGGRNRIIYGLEEETADWHSDKLSCT